MLLAGALGGCEAAGEPGGNRTFSDKDVPFTFEVPADFTDEPVNEGDTRGEVLAAVGFTKLDVIAVRRAPSGGPVAGGPSKAHEVMGREVVSELHPLGDGYVLECQYTEDNATKVREACRTALDTVERRPMSAQG